MEITKEIKAAALEYIRAGEGFTPVVVGDAVREIEGTLIGLTEATTTAYPYTLYLCSPTVGGKGCGKDAVVAISLRDEEARNVLSAIAGVIALPDFPKYPRFSFLVPGAYRSIEVRLFTRRVFGRAVGIVSPTDITNKEVLAGAFRLINTALQREKYPVRIEG